MRMSEAVEWALHATTTLALLPPHAVLPGKALAEYLGVSESYLLKNLKLLAAAGLLVSVPGPKGGYRLGRTPGDITLLDVVRAIEGPEPAFRCADVRANVPFPCPPDAFRRACSIKVAMLGAQRAYDAELQAKTILDMVQGLMADLDPRLAADGEVWFRQNVRFTPPAP